MIARRSPKVKDGRQRGVRIALSDPELDFLRERAAKRNVSISNLIRSAVAAEAIAEGVEPPDTLCSTSDYTEGFCPH